MDKPKRFLFWKVTLRANCNFQKIDRCQGKTTPGSHYFFGFQQSIQLHSQRATNHNSVYPWSAKENTRSNKHNLQRHCGKVITPDAETDLFEVIDVTRRYSCPFSLHYCVRLCTSRSYQKYINRFYVRHDKALEKNEVLGNQQYSSLTQVLLMILPCFQTISNNPSFFYKDWKLKAKPLDCISTARRHNIS